jgi:DNA-binding XRE family transcriptional regulator
LQRSGIRSREALRILSTRPLIFRGVFSFSCNAPGSGAGSFATIRNAPTVASRTIPLFGNDRCAASRSISTRIIPSSQHRAARKAKGLSQEALGELADLHPTYVGSVERGERNISVDNMDRLARALGLDVVDLLRQPV